MPSIAIPTSPSKVDITLLSSDGARFPFRRSFLETASPWFEEALSKGKKIKQLQMQEPSVEVNLFLRFIDRDAWRSELTSVEDLISIIHTAHGYRASDIVQLAFDHLSTLHPHLSPPFRFAAAVLASDFPQAQKALVDFGFWTCYHRDPNHHSPEPASKVSTPRTRRATSTAIERSRSPCELCEPPQYTISDVPKEYRGTFSMEFLKGLEGMQESVLRERFAWDELKLELVWEAGMEANTFDVSHSSIMLATPSAPSTPSKQTEARITRLSIARQAQTPPSKPTTPRARVHFD